MLAYRLLPFTHSKMYSVVITTFHKRLETWLKPLVKEIKRQRPDIEVILAVNGEKDYFNQDYRKELFDFVKDYQFVYPIPFPRFRALSRLWNLGIQFSTEDTVLVLNDDLTLEEGFFDEYEQVLKTMTSFMINVSFTAYSISKKELMDLNWFDERLLGIGWEDTDLIERYKKYKNFEAFPNANIEWCKNVVNPEFFKVHNEKLANYIENEKPEDRINGQTKDKRFSRYSEFNRLLSLENPLTQYPYERFYLDNKHKL